MRTITDSTGADLEVFTAEEKEAALEEYRQANPDKSEELSNKEEELKTVQEELEKLKTKDHNFEKLRDSKKVAEGKVTLEELEKKIKEEVALAQKSILEGVNKDHYVSELSSLTGDDDELKKKIELQYNRLTDPATTKQDISKKLRDAWLLATRTEELSSLNSAVLSSGGVSRLNFKGNKKFSQEDKELGQKFGLDAKDFEKYGK